MEPLWKLISAVNLAKILLLLECHMVHVLHPHHENPNVFLGKSKLTANVWTNAKRWNAQKDKNAAKENVKEKEENVEEEDHAKMELPASMGNVFDFDLFYRSITYDIRGGEVSIVLRKNCLIEAPDTG